MPNIEDHHCLDGSECIGHSMGWKDNCIVYYGEFCQYPCGSKDACLMHQLAQYCMKWKCTKPHNDSGTGGSVTGFLLCILALVALFTLLARRRRNRTPRFPRNRTDENGPESVPLVPIVSFNGMTNQVTFTSNAPTGNSFLLDTSGASTSETPPGTPPPCYQSSRYQQTISNRLAEGYRAVLDDVSLEDYPEPPNKSADYPEPPNKSYKSASATADRATGDCEEPDKPKTFWKLLKGRTKRYE